MYRFSLTFMFELEFYKCTINIIILEIWKNHNFSFVNILSLDILIKTLHKVLLFSRRILFQEI